MQVHASLEDRIPLSISNTMEALEIYRYLSAFQMVDLGISKDVRSLRKSLARAVEARKPLIKYVEFAVLPGVGKVPRLYYLTQHGAQTLAELQKKELSDVTYHKGGVQFSRDYFHRSNFISTHIAFRKWADTNEAYVQFFQSYFDKDLRRSRIDTKAKDGDFYIIPDAVFAFDHHDKRRLCTLEMHNGNQTKHVFDQLDKHMTALCKALFSRKYGHESSNFVLSVFDHETTFHSARRRLLAVPDFESFSPLFHFARFDDIKQNFANAWVFADGKPSPLFR